MIDLLWGRQREVPEIRGDHEIYNFEPNIFSREDEILYRLELLLRAKLAIKDNLRLVVNVVQNRFDIIR